MELCRSQSWGFFPPLLAWPGNSLRDMDPIKWNLKINLTVTLWFMLCSRNLSLFTCQCMFVSASVSPPISKHQFPSFSDLPKA